MSFTVIIKTQDEPVSVNVYSPFERRDANGAITERGNTSHEIFVEAGVEHACFCKEGDNIHIQALPAGGAGLHDYRGEACAQIGG